MVALLNCVNTLLIFWSTGKYIQADNCEGQKNRYLNTYICAYVWHLPAGLINSWLIINHNIVHTIWTQDMEGNPITHKCKYQLIV